jgi:hypothetical protein
MTRGNTIVPNGGNIVSSAFISNVPALVSDETDDRSSRSLSCLLSFKLSYKRHNGRSQQINQREESQTAGTNDIVLYILFLVSVGCGIDRCSSHDDNFYFFEKDEFVVCD